MMTEGEHILHRYFIWADRMRIHFEQELRKRGNCASSGFELKVEEFMYMSLWYAQLYTVVEGWKELKLSDSVVDKLVAQTHYVSRLRKYRNCVDHFQKDYFDDRFTKFVASGDSAVWVGNLQQAFSQYFLQRMNAT